MGLLHLVLANVVRQDGDVVGLDRAHGVQPLTGVTDPVAEARAGLQVPLEKNQVRVQIHHPGREVREDK